jgi:hypothetical protein
MQARKISMSCIKLDKSICDDALVLRFANRVNSWAMPKKPSIL